MLVSKFIFSKAADCKSADSQHLKSLQVFSKILLNFQIIFYVYFLNSGTVLFFKDYVSVAACVRKTIIEST